jgi:hypothetical protein
MSVIAPKPEVDSDYSARELRLGKRKILQTTHASQPAVAGMAAKTF